MESPRAYLTRPMNRLTYSLRRSLLMTFISKVSRRISLSFTGSRSLSDTRLGLLISTGSIIADWNLAAAQGKRSLLVTVSLFLGFWRISVDVII